MADEVAVCLSVPLLHGGEPLLRPRDDALVGRVGRPERDPFIVFVALLCIFFVLVAAIFKEDRHVRVEIGRHASDAKCFVAPCDAGFRELRFEGFSYVVAELTERIVAVFPQTDIFLREAAQQIIEHDAVTGDDHVDVAPLPGVGVGPVRAGERRGHLLAFEILALLDRILDRVIGAFPPSELVLIHGLGPLLQGLVPVDPHLVLQPPRC